MEHVCKGRTIVQTVKCQAWHTHDAGSTPHCGKQFFSESTISAESQKCLYSPCVQLHALTLVPTLKILISGSHTTVWTHKNTIVWTHRNTTVWTHWIPVWTHTNTIIWTHQIPLFGHTQTPLFEHIKYHCLDKPNIIQNIIVWTHQIPLFGHRNTLVWMPQTPLFGHTMTALFGHTEISLFGHTTYHCLDTQKYHCLDTQKYHCLDTPHTIVWTHRNIVWTHRNIIVWTHRNTIVWTHQIPLFGHTEIPLFGHTKYHCLDTQKYHCLDTPNTIVWAHRNTIVWTQKYHCLDTQKYHCLDTPNTIVWTQKYHCLNTSDTTDWTHRSAAHISQPSKADCGCPSGRTIDSSYVHNSFPKNGCLGTTSLKRGTKRRVRSWHCTLFQCIINNVKIVWINSNSACATIFQHALFHYQSLSLSDYCFCHVWTVSQPNLITTNPVWHESKMTLGH